MNQMLSSIAAVPTAAQTADAVRAELAPELAQVAALQNGLTSNQATMLLEIYQLYGLDPTIPLIVTANSRTAGSIVQTLNTNTESTTVTRVAVP